MYMCPRCVFIFLCSTSNSMFIVFTSALPSLTCTSNIKHYSGDRYGRYLFYLLPPLGLADSILLGPFKLIYGIVPFAQLIFFIGLSVLSRNQNISRPVRFNIQQALILDIALIFPSLLGQLIPIPMPGMIVNSGSNFVYLAMLGSVSYAFISNLSGNVPDKIPVISDAAGSQIP